MPVIRHPRSAGAASLGVLALLHGFCGVCGFCALPGCSVLRTHDQSTVAQGKYYASGEPRYDDFFVGLFLLQVEMEQAPHVPELERLNLAHVLGLTPQASGRDVGQRLHDEAQKLSRAGLRMRLDQNAPSQKPDAASATVRTSERPDESATTTLLDQVETSATRLLRSLGELKQADEALDGLELSAGGLDASVDKDFTATPSKRDEVKRNLADAHRLIALMKTRGSAVRSESEQLLSAVAQAVDTDDGSLGSTDTDAAEAAAEAAKSAEAAKKSAAKAPLPKPKPKLPNSAALSTARSKPPAAENDEPAKLPSKPSTAAVAPRDFEP